LDADSVIVVPGLGDVVAPLDDPETLMIFERLASLSESPRTRVVFIGGDTMHRLQGRAFIRERTCDADRLDLAVWARGLMGEISHCPRRVLLYVCGRRTTLPVLEGHDVVTLRIAPRRNGADYVLPTVAALARLLSFLGDEFVGARPASGLQGML